MSRRDEFNIFASHVSELIHLTYHLAGLASVYMMCFEIPEHLIKIYFHFYNTKNKKYLNEVPQLYFKPFTTKS